MTKTENADLILAALRAAEQREARIDPRWEALTMDALPPDEAEALRREDPDRYDLHRPLDRGELDELCQHLLEHQAERKDDPMVAAEITSGDRGAIWARFQKPLTWGAGIALAAGVLLGVTSLSHHSVQYGWSESRGGGRVEPKHVAAGPDAPLSLVIVPLDGRGAGLVVRGALLVRPGSADPGRAHLVVPRVTIDEDNLILWGKRIELFPGAGPGEWDLIVILGPAGKALAEDEVRRLAEHGTSGELQVLPPKRLVLDGQCVGTPVRPCSEGDP